MHQFQQTVNKSLLKLWLSWKICKTLYMYIRFNTEYAIA